MKQMYIKVYAAMNTAGICIKQYTRQTTWKQLKCCHIISEYTEATWQCIFVHAGFYSIVYIILLSTSSSVVVAVIVGRTYKLPMKNITVCMIIFFFIQHTNKEYYRIPTKTAKHTLSQVENLVYLRYILWAKTFFEKMCHFLRHSKSKKLTL